MDIKKGSSRISLIFPSLGFVVKIPRIKIIIVVKDLFKILFKSKNNRIPRLALYFKKQTDSWARSFKGNVFRGTYHNLNEFIFFVKTRNAFLQPTYFSFFGLLNIQKYGDVRDVGNLGFCRNLYELTEGAVRDDTHHFSNPENFCINNGRLRILDYGSPRTQGVILQYGNKIYEQFDPDSF